MSIVPALTARDVRRLVLISALFLCSGFAFGQAPQLRSGSTVYIEPMDDDFNTYLAAAFVKQSVPLEVVTKKKAAEYVVQGTFSSNDRVNPYGGNPLTVADASITVVEAGTKLIVFSQSVGNIFGNPSYNAEKCANRLKEFIEKPERLKKYAYRGVG